MIVIPLIIIYIIGFIITFFILAKIVDPDEEDHVDGFSYIGAALIWPLVLFIFGIAELEKISINLAKEIHGENESQNKSIYDNGFFDHHD